MPKPRTTNTVLNPTHCRRDEMLASLQGFDPNVRRELEVPIEWIEQRPELQPRVKGEDAEQVERLGASMSADGQDIAVPVFLNPDLNSNKPFLNFGGNQRLAGLRAHDETHVLILFRPDVDMSTAARLAYRDNTGLPMSLRDEMAFVAREMRAELARIPNPPGADQATRIRAAAERLAPYANKKPTYITVRYVLTTLHPEVQKMLWTKSYDSGYIGKNDGLLLAQIPDKDRQLAVARNMQGKPGQTAAKILDDAIQAFAPAGSKRVDPSRLNLGDGTLAFAARAIAEHVPVNADNGGRNEPVQQSLTGIPFRARSMRPARASVPLTIPAIVDSILRMSRRLNDMQEDKTRLDNLDNAALNRCLTDARSAANRLEALVSHIEQKLQAIVN